MSVCCNDMGKLFHIRGLAAKNLLSRSRVYVRVRDGEDIGVCGAKPAVYRLSSRLAVVH